MRFRWNRFDKPVLMARSKSLLTELGIPHTRLESCMEEMNSPRGLVEERNCGTLLEIRLGFCSPPFLVFLQGTHTHNQESRIPSPGNSFCGINCSSSDDISPILSS